MKKKITIKIKMTKPRNPIASKAFSSGTGLHTKDNKRVRLSLKIIAKKEIDLGFQNNEN